MALRLLDQSNAESNALLRIPKRNSFAFFTTVAGRAIRLIKSDHCPTPTDSMNWCMLCSCPRDTNFSNHQSRYRCSCCTVPLCLAVYKIYRRNCWMVWHNRDTLVPRKLPKHITDAPSASSPATVRDRIQATDRDYVNDGSSKQAGMTSVSNAPDQHNLSENDRSDLHTIEDCMHAPPLSVPARAVTSARTPPPSEASSPPTQDPKGPESGATINTDVVTVATNVMK